MREAESEGGLVDSWIFGVGSVFMLASFILFLSKETRGDRFVGEAAAYAPDAHFVGFAPDAPFVQVAVRSWHENFTEGRKGSKEVMREEHRIPSLRSLRPSVKTGRMHP